MKIGVYTADNELQKDPEQWAIERYPLVRRAASSALSFGSRTEKTALSSDGRKRFSRTGRLAKRCFCQLGEAAEA